MRWKALLDLPMGTQVGRAFQGADGVSRAVLGQVYDSQVPYWRAVSYTHLTLPTIYSV